MTNAQLEQALQALAERVAALEQRHADEDAAQAAAAEAERVRRLRDEVAAHRRGLHPAGADDVEQITRWNGQVDRAVNHFRRRTA